MRVKRKKSGVAELRFNPGLCASCPSLSPLAASAHHNAPSHSRNPPAPSQEKPPVLRSVASWEDGPVATSSAGSAWQLHKEQAAGHELPSQSARRSLRNQDTRRSCPALHFPRT